jgi:hypothetical protein
MYLQRPTGRTGVFSPGRLKDGPPVVAVAGQPFELEVVLYLFSGDKSAVATTGTIKLWMGRNATAMGSSVLTCGMASDYAYVTPPTVLRYDRYAVFKLPDKLTAPSNLSNVDYLDRRGFADVFVLHEPREPTGPSCAALRSAAVGCAAAAPIPTSVCVSHMHPSRCAPHAFDSRRPHPLASQPAAQQALASQA